MTLLLGSSYQFFTGSKCQTGSLAHYLQLGGSNSLLLQDPYGQGLGGLYQGQKGVHQLLTFLNSAITQALLLIVVFLFNFRKVNIGISIIVLS